MSRKKKKPQWRQEGGRLVATITQSAHDIAVAHRRGQREALKEAGMLHANTGAGVHGGGKREHNRRDRRDANRSIRAGRFDGYCDD